MLCLFVPPRNPTSLPRAVLVPGLTTSRASHDIPNTSHTQHPACSPHPQLIAQSSIPTCQEGLGSSRTSPRHWGCWRMRRERLGAGQCQGDAPCATWHSADLSISTGLFLTIFGPFHLFLNVFLLFAQVLCANWELASLGVGGLSGLPHDRFTLSPCLHILAVWFFCNVLDLDFTSQC